MKKAKFLLAILVLGACTGSVWASRIRVPHTFYKKTAANGACNVQTVLFLTTTSSGGFTTQLSELATTSTVCQIRVTISL